METQMSNAAKGLFGGGQDKLLKAQKKAREAENARVSALEAGQKRNQEGGRGFLAFVDNQLNSNLG
jgi:hypothetical protein